MAHRIPQPTPAAQDPPGTLRFACQPGCTACCEASGYVYLTEEDVAAAAGFLGLSVEEFSDRYLSRTARRIRLRRPGDGRECPFLDPGRCRIHPVKPTQCRLFPFWPELVENRAAWNTTARRCPGIGMGDLIQIGSAVELASEMRRAYPEDYQE